MALQILGFGLRRPFVRDLKADFASAEGAELVRAAVGQILGTRGSSDFTQGEVPWRTEFGSTLHLRRHMNNDDVLVELARVDVTDALRRWEPRVIVRSVEIVREDNNGLNTLSVRVEFDLISRNVPGNNVLLEGLETTITLT